MAAKVNFKTSWDLTPLIAADTQENFDKEAKRVEEESYKFINKWKDRTDYLTDPKILKEALDEYDYWIRVSGVGGTLSQYYNLLKYKDESNADYKAKVQKVEDLENKISNEIQFFYLRLGQISKDKQGEMLDSPLLAHYQHYLARLFLNSRYQLSESEEKIMNLKDGPSYGNWVNMTSGLLSKEERKVLNEEGKEGVMTLSQLSKLTSSTKKKVRDIAAKAFNDIVAKYAEVAEAELNAIVNNHKVNDELRKRSRPDLARHVADDIDTEVVDALLNAVSSRNEIAHRIYKLKAALLGVKKLSYHERNVPYGSNEKKYSYSEAFELTKKVFNKLDPQFGIIFEEFHNNGQVDVYPSKGKSPGAFCYHDLINKPTYLLLNHQDKLDDVFTLAHEFGHAINYELMKKKQNAINFSSPLSTAEVASTFMEDFVLTEVLKQATEEERLILAVDKLDSDVGSIFRQVACYQFEQELHKKVREKGYLSKEEIGKLFLDKMAGYMGPAVEMSAGSENWWVYWSHIRSFFYVYSYSSGLLISKSLQSSVKNDPKFIDSVKVFLESGRSDSPKNIFAKLGVDITDPKFWNKGLDEVEQLLDETEKLARKLGKIK